MYLYCGIIRHSLQIGGIAKSIKKFFNQTDVDNSLYVLKGALEDLTRMKTEMCLEHLKDKLYKTPTKRPHGDAEDQVSAKKSKCD